MLGTTNKKLVFEAVEFMELSMDEVSFYLSLTFNAGYELVILKD